jgi:hypothetical protein
VTTNCKLKVVLVEQLLFTNTKCFINESAQFNKTMIMWDKVQETVQFIKAKNDFNPEYGVILGSGLGSFTDDMDIALYSIQWIINFPVSTART